jgi:DNA polymerase-3 subunit delta'
MTRLAEVVGQDGLIALLERLLAANRLPHTVLLEGLPGCGRRTLARALAQALLCASPKQGDACGVCPSCLTAAAGTHPDIVALPHDSESDELPVERVRDEVVARAYESPLVGSRRAFLIYGAERLRDESANALLKALEEPPPGAYFILTTAQSTAVLKTIRSRSQLFRLQPLSAADLVRVLRAGGVSATEAEARAMRGAGGHRGLWGELESAPIAQLRELCVGGLRSELVAEVVAALPQKITPEQEEAGLTVAKEQRRALRQWLIALAHELQRELRADPSPKIAARIERLAPLHHDLELNLQPRLVIEALALGASR